MLQPFVQVAGVQRIPTQNNPEAARCIPMKNITRLAAADSIAMIRRPTPSSHFHPDDGLSNNIWAKYESAGVATLKVAPQPNN